jgi:type II secretory pathway component GspD/PulD (secretin)
MNDSFPFRSGSLSLIVMLVVSVLQGPRVTAQQTPVTAPAEKKPAAVADEKTPVAPPAEQQPAVEAVPVAKSDGLLRFTFEGTPWREVIKWIADESDLALHIQDQPAGSFTYSDPNPFTHQEALNRINLFLLSQDYTLVRSGKLLSLINLGDPRSLQQLDVLARLVTPDQLEKMLDHEVVKCVFTLKDIKAADAAEELASLKLMTVPSVFAKTNRLMITERAGKLKSVKLILDAFEPSALSDGMVMKNFSLEHVEAEDILIVARPHLGLAAGEMIGIDVSLSSDLLGKNIFVTGVDDKVKLIEGLIASLDKPQKNLLPSEEAVLQTHNVQGGNVETVYNVLQTLLAGKQVRLSMDAAAGNIVALGAPEVQLEISQTVSQLQASEAEFEIIPLKHVDPYFAISLLEQMLDLSALRMQAAASTTPQFSRSSESRGSSGSDRDRSRSSSSRGASTPKPAIDVPMIDADPGNRRLYVRAKKPMMERIKKMVTQLDVPTGVGGSNDEIRLFPLRGKEAERLVQAAARFWRGANPIILHPPIYTSSVQRRERIVASGAASGAASSQSPVTPVTRPEKTNPEVLAGDIRSPIPAIRCQLTPRGMLLQSLDTKALDHFYQHLQAISGPTGSVPSPPVVFYLKYTKPDEALRILSELLDGGESALEGEAGSLVNGYVSSPGASLLGSLVVSRSGTVTLTSGTITVVADSRLNRLIVQGTDEDIEIVENYLKIVDKDNSITVVETYGRSHVIELFHTRASEVAATIREAYGSRVSASASSRTSGQQGGSSSRSGSSQSGQRSSSQQKSGGENSDNRGSDGDRKSSERKPSSQSPRSVEPKLTIAVHEASNSLIVTAPEQLFKEVEALVKVIDSRNEQTVRIITKAQAGGIHSVLQQVLSGEASRPSSRSGSSPSRSSGSTRSGSTPSRSSSGTPRSSSPSRTSGSSRGSGR